MSIIDRAADALNRARRTGLPLDDPPTTPTWLRRRRARITRHVSTLLGLDPAHVHVGDDPRRGTVAAGALITVNEGAWRFRFIPETGDDELFLLLAPCPSCDGEVPMSRVGGLIDLGLHLERDATPGNDWPGSMPVEFDLDPGHAPDCAISPRGVAAAEADGPGTSVSR